MAKYHDRTSWLKGGVARCLTPPGQPAGLPWRLVLLGAPGVGKGTQSDLLCERLGACHLSTGDVFRASKSTPESELSPALTSALDFMSRGALVPDETVLQMVAERKFRADLYYRLHVFPITLPALRERTKDIPLLVRHFAALFAARMSKPIPWMPEGVMDAFLQYSWPGNVRELQNLVERAVLIGNFHQVAPAREQMPGPRLVHTGPCGRTLHEMERLHITDALEETNWIVGGRAGAAAKLGLPRTTLMSRMRKLGISRETPPAARSRSTPAEAFMMSRSGGAFAHSAGL